MILKDYFDWVVFYATFNIISVISHYSVNALPDLPILGSSRSAADKDMMAKIWTNGDTIICFSRKHCGRRRNCS